MDLSAILDRLEYDSDHLYSTSAGPAPSSPFWSVFHQAIAAMRAAGDDYDVAWSHYSQLMRVVKEECPNLNLPALSDLDKAMNRWQLARSVAARHGKSQS